MSCAQVVVVASAGNDMHNGCKDDRKARYDSVNTPNKLLVGSTTDLDKASSFSNYGDCVHVQVPSITQSRPQPRAPLP